MNKNELIKSVKTQLEKVGHGIAFDLIDDGVRQEDSWWYVPVLATRNGKHIPREITVSILANIEDELERVKHVSVLFIPAVSDAKHDKARTRTRRSKKAS
jgi:hypothetical protein